MSPFGKITAGGVVGVPRASGDEPPRLQYEAIAKVCSPRERG